jgi:hypothetical protein
MAKQITNSKDINKKLIEPIIITHALVKAKEIIF